MHQLWLIKSFVSSRRYEAGIRKSLGFPKLKFLSVLDFACLFLMWKRSSSGLERIGFYTEESSAVVFCLAVKAEAAANRSIWKDSARIDLLVI